MRRRRSSSRSGGAGLNLNLRERFDNNRQNVMIGMAGLILLLAIFFPRLYPAARRGPECSSLANPIGGNNRSILAQTGNKSDAIDLDISVDNAPIDANETLRITLTFVNTDIGPTIIYLNPNIEDQPPLVDQNQTEAPQLGVFFTLTRVDTNQSVTNGIQAPPALTQFSYEELHLLGSRARCSEQIEFRNLGLQPGDYRIRAYYRNREPGVLPQPAPGDPTATATAAYTTQGVWEGDAASEEVRFTVRSPTVATPIPPG